MSEMILPGTYIEVRPEGLISPPPITIGNVGVVGTAAKGLVDQVIGPLGSLTDAVRSFGNYDPWYSDPNATPPTVNQNALTLVRALELIFAFGATTVYAVRAAQQTAAGGSLAVAAKGSLLTGGVTCLTLAANSPGSWGNNIGVNVADADQNAIVDSESHAGAANITLDHKPVQSSQNDIKLNGRSLQIVYDPVVTPNLGQVLITRANGTLKFGDPVAATDKVLATYAVDQANCAKVTIQFGQAQEFYTIADVNGLAKAINDPNAPSAWVTASAVAAQGGKLPQKTLPVTAPPIFASLAGGTNGEKAAESDYVRSLSALTNQDVQIIVAAGQHGQPDGFGSQLDVHCQKASTDSIKSERIAIVGSKLGAKLNEILSHNLNSDRVVFVAPGMNAPDSALGAEVTLPGAYTAAAVAGLLASLAPHISLTNKSLRVDDLEKADPPGQYFSNAQLTQLVLGRVLAVENHLGFHLVKGITTEQSGGPFSQITTRRIVDFAKKGVRASADPYIGLLNNERVRGALRATLNSFLAGMVEDEMLEVYDLDVFATRDDEIKGICEVTMTLKPTFSIDYVKVTMYLG
jgi:hypothetical protein